MTQWVNRTRKDGLSLRHTFVLMLVLSIGITVLLLFTTYHTIKSFRQLSAATNTYIELADAAESLMQASDYLTEEAQCYAVLGERRHLDNYFEEAEVIRRRETAIETMEDRLPDSGPLQALKGAMGNSLALMEREYYAMKLVLLAQGDPDVPAALADTAIDPADEALSAEEKMARARVMVHDSEYYDRKDMIRSDLSACIEALKTGTHGTQDATERRMREDLTWMTVLIVFQSLAIVMLLWVTTSLGINPLLRAVDHIKQDQKLPITGAHEFRYLADTYNKMYTAYKKSIDNLSFKASHDELTGVYNRAGYDLIKHSVDLATTAFLLFDADQFKHVNDDFGHEVGDETLKKIAAALRRNFRSDDYIFRIGGDEFMVLMVHVSPEVAPLIEQKVIQINQDLAVEQDGLPPISVSAGVSLCRGTEDPQQLFHEADIALYYVKDHGRNGCCFYREGMQSHGSNISE